jgi:hypothetical protein
MLRDFAPQVPLIARVNRAQTVKRLYQVGTDFALSIGQVAGQLLAHQMLGEEYVNIEPTVKIIKVDGSSFAGRHPLHTALRGRGDVLVVALERGEAVVVEFGADFRVAAGDALYLCGAPDALDACCVQYPELRQRPLRRPDERATSTAARSCASTGSGTCRRKRTRRARSPPSSGSCLDSADVKASNRRAVRFKEEFLAPRRPTARTREA